MTTVAKKTGNGYVINGEKSYISMVRDIKNLVPYMLFFMPSIASVAVTAGYYLASSEGVFHHNLPCHIHIWNTCDFTNTPGFRHLHAK